MRPRRPRTAGRGLGSRAEPMLLLAAHYHRRVSLMLYTRHDLRLASRGWHGGVLEEGVMPGNVLGVALNAAARQVIYTLVPRRRAAKLPGAIAHQTGTARTELPTGEVRLTGRARVYVGGRAVGYVSHVWCDRLSGLVTHVLVRDGGGLFARGHERVLPIEARKSTRLNSSH